MLKTVHQDPQWKDDSTQRSPRGALKFLIILRRNCLKILCFLRKNISTKNKNRTKMDISKKDKSRAVVTLRTVPFVTESAFLECFWPALAQPIELPFFHKLEDC